MARPDIHGSLYVDCNGDCDPSECSGRHPIRCACGNQATEILSDPPPDGACIGVCDDCAGQYELTTSQANARFT